MMMVDVKLSSLNSQRNTIRTSYDWGVFLLKYVNKHLKEILTLALFAVLYFIPLPALSTLVSHMTMISKAVFIILPIIMDVYTDIVSILSNFYLEFFSKITLFL